MHYKKSRSRILAAVLSLVLLVCLAAAAGPAVAESAVIEEDPGNSAGSVRVSSVDDFLAAIGPDTAILLDGGTYDLSTASDYGRASENPWYSWVETYDGYELSIENVTNLSIRGSGMDDTVLSAVPRYSNVLSFTGCNNVTVANLTAGHTREPGYCAGGVLYFQSGSHITVNSCGLYGCGTVGVWAQDCRDLTVLNSSIYECSYSAVDVSQCRNVLVDNCEIYNHGLREDQGAAGSLFSASYSEGFTVARSRIHNNFVQYLFNSSYTRSAAFLSNDVTDNGIMSGVFSFQQYGATVDGCAFDDNSLWSSWYVSDGVLANDLEGNLLSGADLNDMTLREVDLSTVVEVKPAAPALELDPGATVGVTTVDELLAAIGPDRTIVLQSELFDLSAASDYGGVGGEYYYWKESYDGPELVIHDVSGLTLVGNADDPEAVTLAAIPRYANVLNFQSCQNITLLGFTAGHTKEPGSCSGGVVNLDRCESVTVDSCRLYGCGVLGVQTTGCTAITLLRTEIYECSQGAASFFQTDGVFFLNCDIHDVPSPAFSFYQCGDLTWNDEPFSSDDSMYDVLADGSLVPFVYESEEENYYTGSVDDLVNPFALEPTFRYDAGSPQVQFVTSVRQAIADGDWETFSRQLVYPVQIFVPGGSYPVEDRATFLWIVENPDFIELGMTFNEDSRRSFANASLEEFGLCIYGTTFCDHRLAFAEIGDPDGGEVFKVTAISFDGPFYPGTPYAPAVPPTPEV